MEIWKYYDFNKKHLSKVLFRLSVEKGQTHGIFKSDFTIKNSTIIIP